MSLISAEFQNNGFSEHHVDIKSETTSSSERSPAAPSVSSMDRLARELSSMLRQKSKTCEQDDDVDDAIIQEVRRRVIETTTRTKDVFDESDIKWISETDDMIFRNVLVFRGSHPKNQEMEVMYKSVHDAVISTLKWRHSFGVNNVRDEDIPKEFFNVKAVLFYIGTDGRLYICMKVRKYRKFSNVWVDISIRFAVHEIDKRLKEYSYKYKRGIYDLRPVIIFDGQKIGMAQMDLKNFFIGRSIFQHHYPKTFNEVWIYGMPWWTTPFVTIAIKALPEYVTNHVKLVDTESMIREIGEGNVPETLGGALQEVYIEPPAVTMSVEQLGRQVGASRSEIKRLIEHLRSVTE